MEKRNEANEHKAFCYLWVMEKGGARCKKTKPNPQMLEPLKTY
jgi:hypothetical protein